MGADAEDWKEKLKALGIARRRRPAPPKAADRRKVETGRVGEEIAARHLEERGLAILERNVRFPDGEIDLVAEEGAVLVFVEVRRRTGGGAGSAAESVTARKRARVVRAARRWLARHGRQAARLVRFDVVALDGDPPAVTWIRGAFDGG
ncbi:MAG TPA: YraN family protein [Thermoanaerobaculia bacterium]|nr:YraN family protein [Thermoanaerobaculia bacterium]